MKQSDKFEEIRLIADAVCDGDVSPEQMKELEQLLAKSDEAKRFYLDYVGMHAHMKAASDSKIELVMRRSQVDEFIVRPAGSESLSIDRGLGGGGKPPKQISGPEPVKSSNNPLIFSLAALCILLLLYIFMQEPKDYLGEVKYGRVKDVERQAYPESIQAGEYFAEKDTLIKLRNSSSVKISAGSQISLMDPNRVFIEKGSLEFIQESDKNFNLSTPNFKMISASKSIFLETVSKAFEIKVNSDNKFMPSRWRPQHYWSFDEPTDRASDSAGQAHGIVSKHIKPAAGLVGEGAYEFNNAINSVIQLGSGGGTALATGSFAVSEGITIEALVKTDWSGSFMDSDEIFRKDKGDENMRMLFCFQNDYGKKHVFPKDYRGPTLSFGLYLVGHGYHELKLPLDGKKGRPTLQELKDGRAHHVVATYDVRSGVKGIYIDGKLLTSHSYSPGTKMITGGPGTAVIGNSPNNMNEAFNGVIDEVAFYNFALPPYMVQYHYDNTLKGMNYYGLVPGNQNLPEKMSIKLPADRTIILDNLTGLPERIKPLE